MEEVQYKAIYDYISVQQYPLGYTKSEKYMYFVAVARALRCKGISSFINTAKLMGLHLFGWLSAA